MRWCLLQMEISAWIVVWECPGPLMNVPVWEQKCYKSTCLPGMTIKIWNNMTNKRGIKKKKKYRKQLYSLLLKYNYILIGVVMRRLHGGGTLLPRGPPHSPPPAVSLPRSGLASEEQDPDCWNLDGHVQENLLQKGHACSFHQTGVCVYVCVRVWVNTSGQEIVWWVCTTYKKMKLSFFVQSENPNITERLRLKRSLGCRNFHWFLTTVYPQLYIPQDRTALSGEVSQALTCSYMHTNIWTSCVWMDCEASCLYLLAAVQCWYWQMCRLSPRSGTAGWGHGCGTVHWDR